MIYSLKYAFKIYIYIEKKTDLKQPTWRIGETRRALVLIIN